MMLLMVSFLHVVLVMFLLMLVFLVFMVLMMLVLVIFVLLVMMMLYGGNREECVTLCLNVRDSVSASTYSCDASYDASSCVNDDVTLQSRFSVLRVHLISLDCVLVYLQLHNVACVHFHLMRVR